MTFYVNENTTMDVEVPSQYLNSFGFIDYKHNGSLPWTNQDVVLSKEYTSITDILGIDCEMVAVGNFKISVLGRVSIVNEHGLCLYDTFVMPEEEITDYGTEFSGIRPEDLTNAPRTDLVVQQVAAIVKGKVLVGHAIHHDLEVLKLNHPIADIRDTANFFQYRDGNKRTPSLKSLIKEYFKTNIQDGEHSSIQDAQATLRLYLLFREEWEKDALERRVKANLADTITDITCMHVQPRPPDLFVESKSVFIRPNKLVGAYASSEEYLDIQFRLLMEDVLRPLRQDVRLIKQRRPLDNHFRNIRVAMGHSSDEKTFEVKSFKTLLVPIHQNGLEEVDWDDRNVFLGGSLLILTPDNFQSAKCAKVIDVAVDERNDPIYLRLFVNFLLDGPNWTVTNKQRFQMLESKAFFLPYEYTLNFLQIVNLDIFPMKKYIVDAVTKSEIAPHLVKNSINRIDFSVLMNENGNQANASAHPLDYPNWPTANQLNLDASQYEALQRAMTQELTIIQGPPGTGKTHISLQIVKLILSNKWLNSSPMLIVAYTNHALDQLLEPVLEFLTDQIHGGNRKIAEQSLLRIGGGCESEIVLPCTLRYKNDQFMRKNRINKQIKTLEKALTKVKNLDFSTYFIERGILNFQLVPQFMLAKMTANEESKDILKMWTKYHREIEKDVLGWFGLSKSSVELKTKSLTSIDDGLFLLLCNNLAAIVEKEIANIPKTMATLKSSPLHNKNLEQQYSTRWGYYFYLVGQLAEIVETSRAELNAARDVSKTLEYYVKEKSVLKQAKIIGMTTTGAVKFKKMLEKKLRPKIMLVEEAAHVLEAYVVASLTQHCNQLILIGDHMQLRPLIADHDLSKDFLDVSLMERLVNNGRAQNTQNFTQLKVQHRMRAEIAKLICPVIYNELENHEDVEKYPDVIGCSKNVFFIHHENAESMEMRSRSRFNAYEAKYIIGLLSYFVNCGYLPSQITVICTYMAQKTLIDKTIQDDPTINEIEISTVDGYQGKQNDLILLSLVRNNKQNNVGFLNMVNRVCVALSRARHGLFMIGNMSILAASSDIWSTINQILTDTNSIGTDLPLQYPDMFEQLNTCAVSILPPLIVNTRTRAKRRGRGGRNKKKPNREPTDQQNPTANNSKLRENIESKVLQCSHATSRIKGNSSETKCMKVTVKKLQCGHEITVHCHQPLASLKCHVNKIVKLACGHQKDVPCGSKSVKDVSCITPVSRKLSCGHQVTIPCGVDWTKVKCNAKKIKKLSCGHTTHVLCSQKRGPSKCGFSIKKNMECGHVMTVACHKLSSATECSAKVTKTFSCGHKITVHCQQEKCNVQLTKQLSCGHKVRIYCGETISNVKCLETVKHKYSCGHVHHFKCPELLKIPKKCSAFITRILPCGHDQKTSCHQNLREVKCKRSVTFHNKKVQCHELKELKTERANANNLLSAGMHNLKLAD